MQVTASHFATVSAIPVFFPETDEDEDVDEDDDAAGMLNWSCSASANFTSVTPCNPHHRISSHSAIIMQLNHTMSTKTG